MNLLNCNNVLKGSNLKNSTSFSSSGSAFFNLLKLSALNALSPTRHSSCHIWNWECPLKIFERQILLTIKSMNTTKRTIPKKCKAGMNTPKCLCWEKNTLCASISSRYLSIYLLKIGLLQRSKRWLHKYTYISLSEHTDT